MPLQGSRARDAGVSLFELLVALAILAIATSLAGVAIGAGFRDRVLERAANQLERDLNQARIDARMSGQPVRIEISETGYRLPALGSAGVDWHGSVAAEWRTVEAGRSRPIDQVDIPPQPVSALHLVVTLRDDRRETRLEMRPYSARISRSDRDPNAD
ncbi:GspH/FimT family pseudopilin [Maricaulis sp.]|uniref:pilus assembly FimT family protein n=1 Tax=Maricaulis sp. TaxID=1486257 RepID=UPI0025BC9903|nr:GspH/FimT family pseudopilin [Maricaulis sp.]